MTDRKTLDQMTSDDLDQLHHQLDEARQAAAAITAHTPLICSDERHAAKVAGVEAERDELREEIAIAAAKLSDMARDRDRWKWYRDDAERRVRIQRERAERAEAAVVRVCALRDTWLRMTLEPGQVRRLLDGLTTALAVPASESATTQATEHSDIGTGLVVHPYLDERNLQRWVFRCWGTDTCDGWLGLGHLSGASALREWDRHVAEAHTEPTPTEPCSGFPDRCPNPVDVPAQSPYHGGGIRCGCGGSKNTTPCPACARADQAGLAPAELHAACRETR